MSRRAAESAVGARRASSRAAVASSPSPRATRAGSTTLSGGDEDGLELAGFLTFVDPPKADAADAIARLHELGVEVKVITGDNDRVASKVCADLALPVRGVLTGTQLDALDDAALAAALPQTTVFARVTPEQKSRVINAQRTLGSTVGFMGDGVNDAVALHDADVGISVDSATDVAKDAADIVLLEKDLDILATGIGEGRRIFTNTIKYVLMATSSNFGNMFSAGAGSMFLTFLPLLPTQILLNNLLYDTSQMTIPTDNVDEEQTRRPAHWDITMIRRFMLFFGPISSLFDFGTFAILLLGFDASHTLFRSGWFVESLATQSLAIFAIRTRRVPFFRSRASTALTASTLVVVAIAFALPFSPLAAHARVHEPAGGPRRRDRRDHSRVPARARAREASVLPARGGQAVDGAGPAAAARAPDSAARSAVDATPSHAREARARRGQPPRRKARRRLAARNAAVAVEWHRRRAVSVVQMSFTERR